METEQFLDQASAAFLGHLVRGEAERRLVGSIAEKDELLREIHHRVKNNLAAVAGLISLEAGRCADEPARSLLVDLEGRISSMALVHEMLYARGGFTGIDFQDYARELAIRVAQSVGVDTEDFTPLVECPELYVPLETAVTLGIMLSELYARSAARTAGGKAVSVALRAWKNEDKKSTWRVEYSENSDAEGAPLSSGLDLVGLIVPQFAGTVAEEPGGLRFGSISTWARGSRAMSPESTDKEMEAFFYAVTHDLRAPLRAIDGFAKMLEEEESKRLSEEGRQLIGIIRGNAVHSYVILYWIRVYHDLIYSISV